MVKPFGNLIIICVILLYSGVIIAQTTVFGKVHDENGKPIDACTIFLINPLTALSLDHTFTDEEGNFKLTAPSSGLFQLEFRNFSFYDTTLMVQLDSQTPLELNVRMHSKVYDLQAVEVVDRLLGIRRSGDTLFYNPKVYANGSETNVGDLLEKLPGITVSPGGQVSYLGHSVDALLLEGHDLVGQNHSDMIRNLLAEDISNVQVIEHFQGQFDWSSSRLSNEKVAINLQLTKESKGTLLGNISVGYGIHQSYLAKLNALRSKEKSGYSLFAGSSNYQYQASESPSLDYYPKGMLNKIGSRRFDILSYEESEDIIPKTRNIEHFIRLTETSKGEGLWTHHTQLQGEYDKGRSSAETYRLRYSDKGVEQRTISDQFQNWVGQLDHDTKLQLASDWTIFIKAHGEADFPNRNMLDTGTVNEFPYRLTSDLDMRHQRYSIEGLGEWRANKANIFRMLLGMSGGHFSSFKSLYTPEMFYFYSLADPKGGYNTAYEDSYSQRFSSIGAEWLGIDSVFEYTFFVKQNFLMEHLEVTYAPDLYFGRDEFNSHWWESGIKVAFPFHEFKLNAELIGVVINDADPRLRVLPSLQISHDVGHLSVLSVSVQRQVSQAGLMYVQEQPILVNTKTIEFSQIAAGQLIDAWTCRLSLSVKPGNYKNVVVVSLSGYWFKRAIAFQEQLAINYISRRPLVLPGSDIYRVTLFGWHTEENWKLNFTHFTAYTDGFTNYGEVNTSMRNIWTRSNLGFYYERIDHWEFGTQLDFQYQQQVAESQVDQWINPALNFILKYTNPRWEFSAAYSQNFNETGEYDLQRKVLNGSLGYKPSKSLTIFIEGRDILNVDKNQSLTAILNPSFYQSTLSETIPGSIAVVCKLSF